MRSSTGGPFFATLTNKDSTQLFGKKLFDEFYLQITIEDKAATSPHLVDEFFWGQTLQNDFTVSLVNYRFTMIYRFTWYFW